MMKDSFFMQRGNVPSFALMGALVFAIAAILGVTFTTSEAEIRIEPSHRSLLVGDTFDATVIVNASVPVNVFAGELQFNPDVLRIKSIDYNTSIADLWAELPWYSNGEGTMNFGGGTYREGGFVGEGELITITFQTLKEGRGIISLYDPHIYRHDGLGTEASLTEQRDAIYTVEHTPGSEPAGAKSESEISYAVVPKPPTTDLNGDGEQSFLDVGIFMMNIFSSDARFDFNLDGKVDGGDLNILIKAR